MKSGAARVVIVGAGHAGGSMAALLRQYGWSGPITLIGAEATLPYQRPPLSKMWLTGEADSASLLQRPEHFYAAAGIDVRLGTRATQIDRARCTVALADGEVINYDRLILATGSQARQLAVPGHGLGNVHTLRTLADAERLKALLSPGACLAVIGAGYIGLEVAASANKLGVACVVIERERRVLARVASAPLSDYFQKRHTAAGVRIILDAAVEALEGTHDRVSAVRLTDGTMLKCDAALIGIGAAADTTLGHAAELACADGIVVDLAARTSDPAIHAIGDCTHRPLPHYGRTGRLESVPNAIEQAKQAAADLCGRPPPAPEVPWFWSDQYQDRLQIAGLPLAAVETVVRGDPTSGTFAVFHLGEDCTVRAVEAVNAPAEFMAGRMMIQRRTKALADRLHDVSCSIREFVG